MRGRLGVSYTDRKQITLLISLPLSFLTGHSIKWIGRPELMGVAYGMGKEAMCDSILLHTSKEVVDFLDSASL
jgi:hypothetical protein